MSLISSAKIHRRKITKIIECFCLDINATRTAKLARVNRKTINRFFGHGSPRRLLEPGPGNESSWLAEIAECDEAYFGSKRKRGFQGKLKRGRGTNKQPVFGVFATKGESAYGNSSRLQEKDAASIDLRAYFERRGYLHRWLERI